MHFTSQICAITILSAVVTYAQRQNNLAGYVDFDFFHWDLAFRIWDKQCAKYNISDSTVSTRITGGQLAQPHMFPYQVGLLLLQAPKVYQCGGVLISAQYVLTAAHCLLRSTLGKVFLGSIDFANPSTSAAVYNVTSSDFLIHESYTNRGSVDDIALIRLPSLAPLSNIVQVIPLARRFMTQSLLQGQIVTASGWGLTSDTGGRNLLLYYVDAPVLPQRECACYYLPSLVRGKQHICAAGTGGRGSCDGDSGGPLTYYYRGVNYLVGLTAFGSAGGCEIGFPSVYTRITSYLDWIAKRTDVRVEN